MIFEKLGLRGELLKAIKTKGYTSPTLIQAKAIPVILDGMDILARAQTGTGKTDAFVLPLVELLSRGQGNRKYPRALVLVPTRELALQVGECVKAYARMVSLRCTVVYGGVRSQPQIARLRRGIDILVATPGRLLDLASQRRLNLSCIEFLVFDEADRMLDMGFHEDISTVLELVPTARRTMLFSATYTRQIRDLAAIMLHEPAFIEVTPSSNAAESVSQKVHLVDRPQKLALLVHLISRMVKGCRVLVFTRTKHGANRLTDNLLAKGVQATALHGNKSQSFRMRTLNEFRDGDIQILIATDVAARGLDISDLPYVINYDMPDIPEDYVHRIGRTGRAGASGTAVSFVCQHEKPHLQAIEKLLQKKIPVEKVDDYTVDSDVPGFVLFRPNNLGSEEKADSSIKEIMARRELLRQQAESRKTKSKGPTKKKASKSKKRSNKGAGNSAKMGRKRG